MPPLASEIMDSSAALLNDSQKQKMTYVVQIPYLKIALRDFSRMAARAGLSVSNKHSVVLTLPSGTTELDFTTNPALPSDLIDIDELWQGDQSTGPFTPVSRRYTINQTLVGTTTSGLTEWAWEADKVSLLPSNKTMYIKLDYLRALFTTFADQNSDLRVINSQSFLEYRNAGLCARYIFEDTERATELDGNAALAFDDITGIDSKAKQSIPARRAPFRAGSRFR